MLGGPARKIGPADHDVAGRVTPQGRVTGLEPCGVHGRCVTGRLRPCPRRPLFPAQDGIPCVRTGKLRVGVRPRAAVPSVRGAGPAWRATRCRPQRERGALAPRPCGAGDRRRHPRVPVGRPGREDGAVASDTHPGALVSRRPHVRHALTAHRPPPTARKYGETVQASGSPSVREDVDCTKQHRPVYRHRPSDD